MNKTRIGFLAAVVLMAALPARADTPADAPQDPLSRARAAFVQLQTGTLDRSTLTPALDADLTEPVRASMTARIASYGPPGKLVVRTKSDVDGVTTYLFRIVWPAGSVDYVFGLDDATGKIAKLYFRPGPGA